MDTSNLSSSEGVPYYLKASAEELIKLAELAELGDVEAQTTLGMRYFVGNSVTQCLDSAREWLQKSAGQGYAPAQFQLGMMHLVVNRYKTALKWLKESAKQGHAEAQFFLGKCYLKGDGVTQCYKTAVKWLKKSAEQDNVDAQHFLGLLYHIGDGVTQCYKTAVKWLKKSAEQGHTEAQYHLGICYLNGTGVTKCYKTAAEWFTKAAMEKSANEGYKPAQAVLAECYIHGRGVTKCLKTAAKWNRKAEKQMKDTDDDDELRELIMEQSKSKCFTCGLEGTHKKMLLCSQCKCVTYCSKKCQKKHWKSSHKEECLPNIFVDKLKDLELSEI